MPTQVATLIEANRGFGGDCFIYRTRHGNFKVSVSWGLLRFPDTVVYNSENQQIIKIDGVCLPDDAMRSLGFECNEAMK